MLPVGKILSFKFFLLSYLLSVLWACVYVHPVYSWGSGVCRDQKRAPDHMELEMQMAVSHQMGAGSHTWVLESRCS